MKKHSSVMGMLLMLLLGIVFWELPCLAHNGNVHRLITKNAFSLSLGLNNFLMDNLGSTSTPLTAQPHGYTASASHLPETWLEWGSYFEDMEDSITISTPYYFEQFDSPRAQDHFYTVAPSRIPGQVIGLTDNSEHILSPWGTNSFAWAAIEGIKPVLFVKPNDQTWPNARNYELAALTLATKSSREENLALMLDSLGHVLHLNQDLTSPDHVRNDNHYIEAHRFIENYGAAHYLQNPQWFTLPPDATVGWANWQAKGFNKLLDFWDRGLYTGGSSYELNQETNGSVKLGLAEFVNGNFLGEDALYNEVVPASDPYHHFPFPSIQTSTDCRRKNRTLQQEPKRFISKADKSKAQAYTLKK